MMHPALVKGDIEFLNSPDGVVAFTRREGNEQMICAFNLGHSAATLDLGGSDVLHAPTGHGFGAKPEAGKIRLGGYEAWFGRMP